MANDSGKPWALWIISGLLTLAFLGAGGSKLADPTTAGETFANHFGLPAALALFIGACEVAGAIGLWLPRLQTLAASGLVIIMLGAAGSHVMAGDPIGNAVAPVVLLVLLCVVILLRLRGGADTSAVGA